MTTIVAFELGCARRGVVIGGFGATPPTNFFFPARFVSMTELKAFFALSWFGGEWLNWNDSLKGLNMVRETLFGECNDVYVTFVAIFIRNVLDVSHCLVRAKTPKKFSI